MTRRVVKAPKTGWNDWMSLKRRGERGKRRALLDTRRQDVALRWEIKAVLPFIRKRAGWDIISRHGEVAPLQLHLARVGVVKKHTGAIWTIFAMLQLFIQECTSVRSSACNSWSWSGGRRMVVQSRFVEWTILSSQLDPQQEDSAYYCLVPAPFKAGWHWQGPQLPITELESSLSFKRSAGRWMIQPLSPSLSPP